MKMVRKPLARNLNLLLAQPPPLSQSPRVLFLFSQLFLPSPVSLASLKFLPLNLLFHSLPKLFQFPRSLFCAASPSSRTKPPVLGFLLLSLTLRNPFFLLCFSSPWTSSSFFFPFSFFSFSSSCFFPASPRLLSLSLSRLVPFSLPVSFLFFS